MPTKVLCTVSLCTVFRDPVHRLRAVTCLRTARNRHVRPRRRFQDFANRQKQRHKQQADTGTQRQTVTDTDSVTQTRTHREDTRRNRHTDTGTGYSSNHSHRRGAAATLPPAKGGALSSPLPSLPLSSPGSPPLSAPAAPPAASRLYCPMENPPLPPP